MIRITAFLLAIFCSAAAAEITGNSPTFKSSDSQSITAKDGQKITVHGIVSSVRKSKGGTNFINFENSDFYLIAFKSDLGAFEGGEPADLYQGKHLAVTGVVSIYNNKPQMKLLRPDMVKIVSEDEPIPTPDKAKKRKASSRDPVAKLSKKADPNKKKKAPPVDPKKYFK